MENLYPRHLALIYRHLSNQDILNATLVCRRWCWQLWRDTEQRELWIPRIAEMLRDKKRTWYYARLTRLTYEKWLRRELANDEVEAGQCCLDLIAEANDTLDAALELWKQPHICVVRPAWQTMFADECPRPFLLGRYWAHGRSNITAEEEIETGCYYFRESHDEFTLSLVCLAGIYQGRMKTGTIYSNGERQYTGEWAMGVPNGFGRMFYNKQKGGTVQLEGNFQHGVPHGQCTFWHHNGIMCYRGDWQEGKRHGAGISYFEDTGRKAFNGLFVDDIQSEGIWYDTDENVIFGGSVREIRERMRSCMDTHECTFNRSNRVFMYQTWFECRTCFGEESISGVCNVCAIRCHQGHDLRPREESLFYCDCGADDAPVKCQSMVACEDTGQCCCAPALTPLPDDDHTFE